MTTSTSVDVLVIGGGPAGLQAALTLGRMRHSVLVVDSGDYRNGSVEHAHNLITHDGRSPEDLRAMARKDVAAYPTVEVRNARVEQVAADGDEFVATIDGDPIRSRRVILATGLRDVLPDVDGLRDIWGVEAAQCPFCHGYEVADQPVAILGSSPHVAMYSSMLGRVTDNLVLLPNGADVPEEFGSQVITAPVTQVQRVKSGVRVTFDGAEPIEVAGIFVHSATFEQSAPFADQLGLALLPSGAIEIDVMGCTNVAGVYAAGDLAHVAALPMPMPSLANAIAAGMAAGATAVRELLGTPARP